MVNKIKNNLVMLYAKAKQNKKISITVLFILILLIGSTVYYTISSSADDLISGLLVTFDKTGTTLKSDDAQNAINELYTGLTGQNFTAETVPSDSTTTASTKFKNFSDITKLNNEYSYSTIFLSKNTKFIVYRDVSDGEISYEFDGTTLKRTYYKNDGTSSVTTPSFTTSTSSSVTIYKYSDKLDNTNYSDLNGVASLDITWTKKVVGGVTFYFPDIAYNLNLSAVTKEYIIDNLYKVLIKNGAQDKNGEYMDALISTKKVRFFNRGSADTYSQKYIKTASFAVNDVIPVFESTVTNGTKEIYSDTFSNISLYIGSPLTFSFGSGACEGDIELSYYKNYGTNSEISVQMDKINSFFGDFDVMGNYTTVTGYSKNVKFTGYEGATFQNNTQEIYYDKNGTSWSNIIKNGSTLEGKICAEGNGLYACGATKYNGNLMNFYNYFPRTSAFVIADNASNKFNFQYSTSSQAGILFSFVSPYKYELLKPKKTASKTKVTDNSNYTYHISQYVPNNYFASLLKLSSDYSLYSSFVITDTFDEKLTNINKNNITVTNDSGDDVTKYFTINVSESNNKTTVTASVLSSFISTSSFYNRTYTLNVPVTTKENINKSKISNKATTTVDGTNYDSNTVDVDVYYNVTAKYLLSGSTTPVSDEIKQEYFYGENYSTLKKDISGYKFVKCEGSETGTVTKDIVVTYYYEPGYTFELLYGYYNNNEWQNLIGPTYETVTTNYAYATEKYDFTGYNFKYIEFYQDGSLISKNENQTSLSGKITDKSVIIRYVYTPKKYKLAMNYYLLGTNTKIAESDYLYPYYNEYYNFTSLMQTKETEIRKTYEYVKQENEPSDFSYFGYAVFSKDAEYVEGSDSEDYSINRYYKVRTGKLTINYYEEGTTNLIDGITADSVTLQFGKEFDGNTYKAVKDETILNNYEYVNFTSDYKDEDGNAVDNGIVSQSSITINYYYKKRTAKVITYYKDLYTKESISKEEVVDSINFGEKYVSTAKTITGYTYNTCETTDSTAESCGAGVVSKDSVSEENIIEITYYYRKNITLTINYYAQGTTNTVVTSGSTYDRQTLVQGNSFNGTTYRNNKVINSNYEYAGNFTSTYMENNVPKDSGTVGSENITINYYYKLKDSVITINYYIQGTTTALANPTTINTHYGENYNTSSYKNNSAISSNYEYVSFTSSTNSESGVVSQGSITVNYYYKLKDSIITINYYVQNTTTKLANPTTINTHYGENYNTSSYKNNSAISSNYEYVNYTSSTNSESGTVNADTIIVNYYYKLKDSVITINYYIQGTTTTLANPTTINTHYGENYNTSSYKNNSAISSNYEYVSFTSSTNSESGVVSQSSITVNYYYRFKVATVIVKYMWSNGVTNSEFENSRESKVYNYGQTYQTSWKDFTGYTRDHVDGVESQEVNINTVDLSTNTITITYYYKRNAKIETYYKWINKDQKIEIENTKVEDTNKYWGDEFTTTQKTITGYTYSGTFDSTYSENGTKKANGVVNADTITVTYYYYKNATITINYIWNYDRSNLFDNPPVDVINTYYGESYKATAKSKSQYDYYSCETNDTTANYCADGTVNQDSIVITFFYKRKATVTTRYIWTDGVTNTEFTNKKIVNTSLYWGDYFDSPYEEISGYTFKNYTSTEKQNKKAGEITQDEIEVIYYYEKNAKVITKYVWKNQNVETEFTDARVESAYKYGDSFSTEIKTFTGYIYDGSFDSTYSENGTKKVSGKVNTDTITVTYYYKKAANVEAVYVWLDNSKVTELQRVSQTNLYYGDEFKTESKVFTGYTYSGTFDSTYSENGTKKANGVVNADTITVTYYYYKNAKVITYYKDLFSKENLEQENVQNKKYGDSYKTTKKEFENYTYDSVSGNEEGEIHQDVVEVTYHYRKNVTITINYYEDVTKNKLDESDVINTNQGRTYDFTDKKNNNDISTDYEYVRVEGNESGTVGHRDIVINYYYKLKSSTITVNFKVEKTNEVLYDPITEIKKYGDTYDGEKIRSQATIPGVYKLTKQESSTGKYSGTVRANSIIITYYYTKIDPTINTNITKTGTNKIVKKDEKVKYTLKYTASVNDYIGNAKLVLTDTLPYEIDVDKSDINGGTYNEENKTIVWELEYKNIYMTRQIEITRNISLVYKGINDVDRIMSNLAEGKLTLDGKEDKIITNLDTEIKIPGTIIIHYIDKDTNKLLSDDETKTDLIGEKITVTEKDFVGYKLIEKPDTSIFTFKEEKQEVTFGYEKIKFNITTKVEGDGGTIEGDEIVKYNEDSTKDKIKIKAEDGYEITTLTVNGKSVDITNKNQMTLDNFKNVVEDKEVIVSFSRKIENPKTLDNILSYVLYSIISIIGIGLSTVIIIKNKIVK